MAFQLAFWDFFFDSLTFLAYFVIPIQLLIFVRHLPVDTTFSRVFLLLTELYYIACGLTHLFSALERYLAVPHAIFLFAKAVTALVSAVILCFVRVCV